MDLAPDCFFRLLVAFFLSMVASASAAERTPVNNARRNAAALFTNSIPLQIEISIAAESVRILKQDSRRYVRATVFEGDHVYHDVGLHLKGSAGSFRQIDDPKPAFTLSFNQFDSRQRFHGLRKIHLNNSVQDASYLNELLAGEVFRQAGGPATRVHHAHGTFYPKGVEGPYVF